MKLRKRLYEIVEIGREDDLASKIFDIILVSIILLNIFCFVAETVPEINAQYGVLFKQIELFSIIVFSIEYIIRLWTCVEEPFLSRMSRAKARFSFATRPYLIIDLLAILPFFLSFILALDLRILRIFRLLWFFKLARYSPALHTIVRTLYNERHALAGAIMLMVTLILFAASGIYFIERHINPEHFGSIPRAAWWAMATLSTVGYGDVVPITPFGKLFGALVMIFGLGMFALPIAIISTGFAQEISRRDFVITWALVARIPLLAKLDAREVAGIMEYLHANNFPPNWELILDNTEGDTMYFIASGEVIEKSGDQKRTLKTGEFFGEVTMLENEHYQNSYITQTRCRLLKLRRSDFLRICNQHPHICAHIRQAAEKAKLNLA